MRIADSSSPNLVDLWSVEISDMLIDLTNTDKKAVIDDKNWDRVKKYKWRYKRSGPGMYYVATSFKYNGVSTTLYLHRLIMDPAPSKDVHHKDGCTLNNLEENLEKQPGIMHRSWHCRNRRFRDTSIPKEQK